MAQQEFKTYRHFFIGRANYSPSPQFDWEAVHKDYDGDGDSRIFRAPDEATLLMVIDHWYENEENSVLRALVGLLDLVLSNPEIPSLAKAAIKCSWRYQAALDIIDSSRGTQKVDDNGNE